MSLAKRRTIKKVMGGVGKKSKKFLQAKCQEKKTGKEEGKEKNPCRRKVQL